MKSRQNQSENKQITISSLYQYVFEDKAKPEIVIHESSKKEKKVATYVQCSLLLQENSPINYVIPGSTKPIYVLAPEGLYYVDDPSKPVSNADLIPDSKLKVGANSSIEISV